MNTFMRDVLDAEWSRIVVQGDDMYAARRSKTDPSLCELGRFRWHRWYDNNGGHLETWDQVGTIAVPMPDHVTGQWLSDIARDRLGSLVTEEDVSALVSRVDDRLRPHLDPDDLEEGEDVYHLGDWGYVRAEDFERAFDGEPEWARDMYMLDGNEPERDAEWASIYNQGGLNALSEALDRQFDENRADSVFYTTAEAPAEWVGLDPADPTNLATGGMDPAGLTM